MQTTKSKIGMLLLLLVLVAQSAAAQVEIYTFGSEGAEVQLSLPADWEISSTSGTFIAQSAPYGSDVQSLTLWVAPPDQMVYGELPADDRVGTLLEVTAAGLPITAEADPKLISRVERFQWGEKQAAAVVALLPREYIQMILLESETEEIIRLSFRSTLPPSADALAAFAAIRASLLLNGDALPTEAVEAVMTRLHDSLTVITGGTASLRVGDTEIRLTAPEDWYRQDVTRSRDFPSQYFFEHDPREIASGAFPTGAVIQVSIAGAARIEAAVGEIPSAGTIAQAYAVYLAGTGAEPGAAFQWGAFPAYRVSVDYPAGMGMHAGGTHQELILIEAGQDVIMLTIYAPDSRWSTLEGIWQNILSGLLINGQAVE